MSLSPSHGGVDRNYIGTTVLSEGLVALSRGRGSKLCAGRWKDRRSGRPLTGAWIETRTRRCGRPRARVALSRGRGSKHEGCAQERGPAGRPLTGAWIETTDAPSSCELSASPSHGGVDRNSTAISGYPYNATSPSHGGVDRNLFVQIVNRRGIGALAHFWCSPARRAYRCLDTDQEVLQTKRGCDHGWCSRRLRALSSGPDRPRNGCMPRFCMAAPKVRQSRIGTPLVG